MINIMGPGRGWIEVISGPMFSGKTEELIRRLRRAEIAKQNVKIFKPKLDDRYDENHLVTHNDQRIGSTAIERAEEIMDLVGDCDVLGIDEAQFFGPELVKVCEDLASQGKRVIVAGLDQDYRGVPFEPIPQLLAVGDLREMRCAGKPHPKNYRRRQSRGGGRSGQVRSTLPEVLRTSQGIIPVE